MTYLFCFDTETTGFIQKDRPASDPSQPHLVQLGCLLMTDTGQKVASVDLIIKPEGYTIPEQAAKVHGITTEIALAVGVPLMIAVAVFTNLRARASERIAHNIAFDDKVMGAAIHRTGRTPASPGPELRSCTMELATPILDLPPTAKMIAAGYNKPKPPTLGECYQYFFEKELIGAHSALVDCEACAEVYFEIRRRERELTDA